VQVRPESSKEVGSTTTVDRTQASPPPFFAWTHAAAYHLPRLACYQCCEIRNATTYCWDDKLARDACMYLRRMYMLGVNHGAWTRVCPHRKGSSLSDLCSLARLGSVAGKEHSSYLNIVAFGLGSRNIGQRVKLTYRVDTVRQLSNVVLFTASRCMLPGDQTRTNSQTLTQHTWSTRNYPSPRSMEYNLRGERSHEKERGK
jgi:hypothetical protein